MHALSCSGAACQGLIYWDEIWARLQLARLANLGRFVPEAPALISSLGWMLEWMGECFDHVWQVSSCAYFKMCPFKNSCMLALLKSAFQLHLKGKIRAPLVSK